MIHGFATSHSGLMLGSVIPGIRREIARTRLVNYLDFSDEKLLGGRPPSVNPVQPYPAMNQEHAARHSFMQKIQALMAGQQHSGVHGPHQGPPLQQPRLPHAAGFSRPGPQLREGYEPVRENRDWRRS